MPGRVCARVCSVRLYGVGVLGGMCMASVCFCGGVGISVGHMRGGFVGGVGCAFRPQWVSLQMSLCGGFGPYMYGRASKVCVHTERSAYTMCM